MSGTVNKVILIGRLARDPEARNFPSGGKIVNLRLATNETWRDKNTGEKRERAEFHSVAIFDEGIAKIAEQYLRKGTTVYIEGQLETRKWQDQSGQDRYSTEVVLRPFRSAMTMLGGKPDNQRDQGSQSGGYGGQQGSSAYGGSTSGASRDFDDEIPFAPEVR